MSIRDGDESTPVTAYPCSIKKRAMGSAEPHPISRIEPPGGKTEEVHEPTSLEKIAPSILVVVLGVSFIKADDLARFGTHRTIISDQVGRRQSGHGTRCIRRSSGEVNLR
jgi:hypothetical protein